MTWTPEELAEMAAADAEIDENFSLTDEEIEASNKLDKEAREMRISGNYDIEKKREYDKKRYEKNREYICARRRAYYWKNREKIRIQRKKEYQEKKRRKQNENRPETTREAER